MNQPLLQVLHPEQVEVEICRSEELERRRGLTSELDEMWSYVRSKANPRWLWHAIDHHTGKVLIVRNLWLLATFGDAIRMTTEARRIEEFSLSNNVVSPSHLCTGKRCKTSKPPRFTKSGQEP